MKRLLIIIACLAFISQLVAQEDRNGFPLNIGVMGHAAIHPGIRIGTSLNLKSWQGKRLEGQRWKSYYLSPQVGIYTYPDVNNGLLVNADIGYKTMNGETRRYSAFALGIGLLNQVQILSRRINLSDGSEEKIRDNTVYFLPTINYQLGGKFNRNTDWYGKFSYGYQIASSKGNTAVPFLELGLQFHLSKN